MAAYYGLMASAAFFGRLYDQSVNYLFASSGPVRVGGHPIYMIGGKEYKLDPTDDSLEAAARLSSEFRSDMDKLPWMTYRSGFQLIPSPQQFAITDKADPGSAGASGFMMRKGGSGVTGFTSDSGWGCTLRTTQMMTASALIRDAKQMNRFYPDTEASLLSLFSDSFSSPLSIHNMIRQSKGRPGKWFGPSQAGWAMAALAEPYINTHVAMDGGLSLRKLKNLIKESQDKGLLVYVPVRLAMDTWINVSESKTAILGLFQQVHQFIGIVGGDITQSYYFVAASEDYLYIMDPHTTQAASVQVVTADNKNQVVPSQPGIMAMRWPRLTSTMMYGFLLHSEKDLIDLAEAIAKIGSKIGFVVHK